MKDSGKKSRQNEVWSGMNSGVDLRDKIPQIVREVAARSAFIPDKLLSTSSWWSESTGVGAFHFNGSFEGKPTVLKVQGVKPATSEVFMIESFEAQNKSRVIRPPLVYAKFPWDDKNGYEAFVLEDVGNNLVADLQPTPSQIDDFFHYYQEYRLNCRNKPWVEKPDTDLKEVVKNKFEEWIKASHKIFPDHPLRENGDEKIIRSAVDILTKNRAWLTVEFVHGHFSARDLFRVKDQIVVLSNLYWSWRTPYYDLIFAYHWRMYDLAQIKDITPGEVEAQRKLWLDKIESIAEDKTLLKYALLERAAAGLNLDALSVDTKKPIARHLVEHARKTAKELIKELS